MNVARRKRHPARDWGNVFISPSGKRHRESLQSRQLFNAEKGSNATIGGFCRAMQRGQFAGKPFKDCKWLA